MIIKNWNIIVCFIARTAFNSDKISYMHIQQAPLILNSQGNVNIFEFRNDNTNLQHKFIYDFLTALEINIRHNGYISGIHICTWLILKTIVPIVL